MEVVFDGLCAALAVPVCLILLAALRVGDALSVLRLGRGD